MSTSDDSARLPAIVVPHHYDLHYKKIDLVRHTFDGTVSIKMTAGHKEWTRPSVILHAIELQLLSATLESSDNKWPAQEFRYRQKNQTVEIVFDSNEPVWKKGVEYTLTIDFIGVLNDRMHGLYRSTYTGLDGKTRTMAVTQFEPTDARRAFPCFDEPAIKATFALTVRIPAALTCLSNTPPASVHTILEGSEFFKTITYEKTPTMSTYLLALVVGEFDSISQTSRGIKTTVYTVPGKANQGYFCLDTAVRCLDFWQDLFGIPYPLTKSDLCAIPDLNAGAMEHYGCITYREAKILVAEGLTSETTKRGIARTLCHELAHMWFGNLVTMEYWTQLWLKEGFARYCEFVAINKLFPHWDAWTEFVQSVYGLAMSLDSMKSSHPVEVEVKHPEEIREIFDSISYAKGASIIRMLSAYLGFEIFLEGLKIYLNRHAYGNATTEMLWQALGEASGLPIVKLMSPWTSQTGFPILILPDGDGDIVAPRFLASGPGSDNSESTCKWPIPVTALVEGSEGVQGPWVIDGPIKDERGALQDMIRTWNKEGKWFKLNAGQSGFYRVAYASQQWKLLAKVMHPSGHLSATDRLGLISDSFAAGRAGYSSIVDSLKLIEDFGGHETAEYAVWQELSENLANLASLYRSEPFFLKFQEFLKRIYSGQLAKLGWDTKEGESERTGTLRGTIIDVLARAGDEAVIEEAFRRFCAFEKESVSIPGDLQGIVFQAAMRHNEAYVYPTLLSIYEGSTFPTEQKDCLAALGCVKDMKHHSEMLDYVLFSGKVRLQDIAFPLNSLSSSSDEGGRACWALFKNRYDLMSARFAAGPMWGPVVALSCRGLRTLAEADEVEAFFQDNQRSLGSAVRRLNQALEAVRTRAARLERDRVDVAKYLASS